MISTIGILFATFMVAVIASAYAWKISKAHLGEVPAQWISSLVIISIIAYGLYNTVNGI